jgi:Fur family transcriptional regulator, peroxide stress response regulator
MKLKKTKQKQAIKEVLSATRSHPTAEWVYTQVKTVIPNISLGTVYRNLNVLRDNGEIMEIYCGGGSGRFDAETRNHYHFKCNICGSIIDIDLPVDHRMDASMNKKTGLNIAYHRTDFYGICADCDGSQPGNKGKRQEKNDGKSSNITR